MANKIDLSMNCCSVKDYKGYLHYYFEELAFFVIADKGINFNLKIAEHCIGSYSNIAVKLKILGLDFIGCCSGRFVDTDLNISFGRLISFNLVEYCCQFDITKKEASIPQKDNHCYKNSFQYFLVLSTSDFKLKAYLTCWCCILSHLPQADWVQKTGYWLNFN